MQLKILLTESATLSRLLDKPDLSFDDLRDATEGLAEVNDKIKDVFKDLPDYCPITKAAPQPTFTIDFETGESNLPGGFELMNGAAVKNGAPGSVAKALRIDSDGPYVVFPNLDISPSKFPEVSMAIEFYLESIPEGSKGWLLNHDNGGFDRAIVLHDERFGGMTHGVGFPAGSVYGSYTTPEIGKWVQIAVTFRQGGECAVFMGNKKAPITHEGKNNDGKSSLILGRVVPSKNHWCDCWIKGVSVYDKGLRDEEIGLIFGKSRGDYCSLQRDHR
jgi:hypothetical protein